LAGVFDIAGSSVVPKRREKLVLSLGGVGALGVSSLAKQQHAVIKRTPTHEKREGGRPTTAAGRRTIEFPAGWEGGKNPQGGGGEKGDRNELER